MRLDTLGLDNQQLSPKMPSIIIYLHNKSKNEYFAFTTASSTVMWTLYMMPLNYPRSKKVKGVVISSIIKYILGLSTKVKKLFFLNFNVKKLFH